MRRHAGWAVLAVMLLAACGSSGSDKAAPATSTTAPAATVTTSTSPSASTSSTPGPTATTVPSPATTEPCDVSGATTPYSPAPSAQAADLLRSVTVSSERCLDAVVLGFRAAKGAPQCSVSYQAGPFSEDASGKPVTVAGTAFLVVRCHPAYSYDPLTGATTYTAPASKHVATSGATRVADVAATGDFEGVMSWVIGLDRQRPFHALATADSRFVIGIF